MLQACGVDQYFQLNQKGNYGSQNKKYVVSPLTDIPPFASGFKSYSIYGRFSIVITDKNQLRGIGYNSYCEISGSLPHEVINHYEPFEIKDDQGRTLVPKSAACGQDYSLYLLEKPEDSTKSILALSYSRITSNYPIILNTGDLNPIALYASCENSAAIDDQGHIIFIPKEVDKSTLLNSFSLPGNEKAIGVAITLKFIFALSSTGKVYSSQIPSNNQLNFSIVKELNGIEIIDISATFDHCLVAAKNGKVYGFGSNEYGELGLGRLKKEAKKFTEISSLKKYHIRQVFAGSDHSLFQTSEGEYLVCGSNSQGQLPIKDKPSKKNYYSPVETIVEKGIFNAVAGQLLSVFYFIGNNPDNSPNRTLNKS